MSEKKIKIKNAETNLDTAALESKLIELKKEQMNQRFQKAAGQLPKSHVIRATKKEIARVMTKMNQGKK